MKHRRGRSAVVMAVGGALLLAACTGHAPQPGPGPSASQAAASASASASPSDDACLTPDTTEAAPGELVYSAGETGFTSYNADVPGADTPTNETVVDRLRGSFWYWGADGELCADTEFGTYEATSTDPLQVTYRIADEAVWSDGVPVTYADFLLDWAAQALATDGTVVGDASDGSTALFDHHAGLALGDLVPAGPQAATPDAREFSYDYERVHADWASDIGSPLPAHVVAEQVGVTVEDLVAAVQTLDMTVLRPAAEFWNSGWEVTAEGTPDPALTPSSGRYVLASDGWEPGGAVTLAANESYWGTPPATSGLTFRSVAADAHVPAIQAGELDVVRPPATVEHLAQLEQIGSTVTVATGPTYTWEHLDFNFAQGLFADSLEAREAFALCVPRQRIVDELVAALDAEAAVLNAREVLPFEGEYGEVVDAAYDGRYDDVDLASAAEKFAAAGLESGTPVRISYPAPNQRRAEIVAAIKESCDQVGFDVVDAGDPDFYGSVLYPGTHDVALFAWSASGKVAEGANTSRTGGPQNHGAYTDATVDEAWAALESTTDAAVQLEQTQNLEKQLWDTLFSIPLFVHPGIDAYRSDVSGVRSSVGDTGAVWSAEQWGRSP